MYKQYALLPEGSRAESYLMRALAVAAASLVSNAMRLVAASATAVSRMISDWASAAMRMLSHERRVRVAMLTPVNVMFHIALTDVQKPGATTGSTGVAIALVMVTTLQLGGA